MNRQTSEIAATLSISVPAATQLARRQIDRDVEAEQNIANIVTLLPSTFSIKAKNKPI
jgi:hypothetical protein